MSLLPDCRDQPRNAWIMWLIMALREVNIVSRGTGALSGIKQ